MRRLGIADAPHAKAPRDGGLPGWRPSLRLLRAGCLLLPLLVLLVWASWSWRAEDARARADAVRNAELLREYALRVLQTQEGVLAHVETILADAERDGADGRELHDRLTAINAVPGAPLSAGYITSRGIVAASSRLYPISVDVSDRPYFVALREAQPATLRVDRLVLRPNGQDVLVVTRRRAGRSFRGVVFATVPIEVFTTFLAHMIRREGGAASLLRSDGVILLRHDPEDGPVQLRSAMPAMQAIGRADGGLYTARAVTDGIERIYAFSRVGDLPLYANFGVATEDVRARWIAGLTPVAALLALAGMLGFAAVDRAMRGLAAEQARERADAELRDARRTAEMQETLLRELHHRVKNSLTMVQSLARLRGGAATDPAMEQRIFAIAKVHDLLHVSSFASRLDLAAYLEALCASPAIVPPERGIAVALDLEPVEVPVEDATPIALIAVELVTNAVKHAFPGGRRGRVEVRLRAPAEPGGMALLVVRDDGVGLPAAHAAGRRHSGLQLLEKLVAQIGGRLSIQVAEGTEVQVALPVRPAQAAAAPSPAMSRPTASATRIPSTPAEKIPPA